MSNFRFKRLEKYKVGGTNDLMDLKFPLPKSPSGKVYRWCPNENCSPRLFLLGDSHEPDKLELTKVKRSPGSSETTCPYCGTDSEDGDFNYDGDIEAIKAYFEWAVKRDIDDAIEKIAKDFNRTSQKGNLFSIKMNYKSSHSPEPRIWREDLIRNLACDICGREYGVYAIALFCPDCGGRNLHIHFEREIELILQQIDLAEQIEPGNIELSYRILGNAHEDVLTAFETYQKTCYKFIVRKSYPKIEVDQMIKKGTIGNRFQNIEKAKGLFKNLSYDPFIVLSEDELKLLTINIEKRHVIGHNLSMADETYSATEDREKPGITVEILADDVAKFAETAKKVILDLERQL
jgi:hypothetical protein